MRTATTGIFHELTTEGGAKSVSITPAAQLQPANFVISGINPMTDDMRNMLLRIWLNVTTTFDPDAAGDAVNWDKFYKGLASAQVTAQPFGTPYPHTHTRGAVLGHLIQVVGLGYSYPQGARAQIPGSTDTDVTIDLFYAIPFALECLDNPMETAQWVGFYDGGTVEAMIAASTVYNGDYAGAVIKAPTTVRCLAETLPSKKAQIGVPFQWRERVIAGGGSSPVLTNVGGETSLDGLAPGCGLAGLWWLTNATGIGLDGPDGVDNFTSLALTWRGQKNIQNLDGLFHAQKVATERRVGPVAGLGTTIIADTAGWPRTMAGAQNNRPSADAEQLFLPLIVPGRGLQTSKVQRVLGNLQVDFGVTTAIASPHRFVSLELCEFSESKVAQLAALGRFGGVAHKRDPGGKGDGKSLRYTALEFEG